MELQTLNEKVFETNKHEIKDIQKTITTITDNIDACDSKITDINHDISTYETETRFKTETLNKIGTNKNKCPVCLKPVTTHDRDQLKEERSKIDEEINKVQISMTDCKRSLTTVSDLKVRLKQAQASQTHLLSDHILKIKDSENNKQRVAQLEKWNSQLDQDLKNFNEETSQFDTSIKEHEDRIKDLEKTVEHIKHQLCVLDVVNGAVQ